MNVIAATGGTSVATAVTSRSVGWSTGARMKFGPGSETMMPHGVAEWMNCATVATIAMGATDHRTPSRTHGSRPVTRSVTQPIAIGTGVAALPSGTTTTARGIAPGHRRSAHRYLGAGTSP